MGGLSFYNTSLPKKTPNATGILVLREGAKEMIEVKWCGFDFGQCLMEPTNLRNPLLFGDILKQIGKPEKISRAIRKYRILKEKYIEYGIMKEGHRDEILNYVLDGDQEAMDLFNKMEKELLGPGEGLEEALIYLKSEQVNINVVSELKKTLGAMTANIISRFLERNNLTSYFNELITPQGKIGVKDNNIDLSYKGLTKQAGTIYDKLRDDLMKKGISPSEAVIVGDKPATDIIPAKERGFYTIQYTGYIDYGPSGAHYKISNFLELTKLIKGKVKHHG